SDSWWDHQRRLVLGRNRIDQPKSEPGAYRRLTLFALDSGDFGAKKHLLVLPFGRIVLGNDTGTLGVVNPNREVRLNPCFFEIVNPPSNHGRCFVNEMTLGRR